MHRRAILIGLVALALPGTGQAWTQGGNVLFLRHALAPGFGDPDHFRLGACATQRNLDARGRDQARALGAALRAQGVRFDAVLSSQWCRCLETARLMEVGPVTPFAGLNSFFQDHAPRRETLALLRDRLAQTPADALVLMVTHQVVIRAITGLSTVSGGAVLHDSVTGQSRAVEIL